MGGLAVAVAQWAPGPVEVRGTLDPWPVAAFAALLDLPAAPGPGEPLPPLWHGFHLREHPRRSELGEDGHPRDGHFLPPVPQRRRMFAGGRLRVRAPMRVGEPVVRRSVLGGVEVKAGRSGELAFVTVRHEFRGDGGPEPLVVEEQDLVYWSQAAGAARPDPDRAPPATPPPATPPAAAPADHRLVTPTDPALLFRFSALTYNTHRIHYDLPYATGVEGYPGLVVHGPLLALLLLEIPRRHRPDARVTSFAYRLRRPVICGATVVCEGRATADGYTLTAAADAITATACLDAR